MFGNSKKLQEIYNKLLDIVKNISNKKLGALLATIRASAVIMGVIPIVVVSGTYLAIKTTSNTLKN